MAMILLVHHIKELVPVRTGGSPWLAGKRMRELGVVHDASVVVRDGIIHWVASRIYGHFQDIAPGLEVEMSGGRRLGAGRKAQPVELKIAKGERRPSRINPERPDVAPPSTESLVAPSGLVGAGLAEWTRLVGILTDAGVLRMSDLVVMENYCRTLTDLRLYERKARRAGAELAIAKGFANQVIKLRTQVNILAREIGLTPSSRSALKVGAKKATPEPDADAKRRYLSAISGGRA